MRIKKRVARLGIICGLVLPTAMMVAGPSSLVALARGPAQSDVTAAATMSVDPPSPQFNTAHPTRKSAECLPRLGAYNRTEVCWSSHFSLTYKVKKKKVGTLKWTVVQSIQFHVIGRDFTEHVSITHSSISGFTIPAYMSLAVSCSNPCRATSHFHPETRIQQGAKGTVSYHDSVGVGGIDPELSHYDATFKLINGHHPNPLKWTSTVLYRCDDILNGQGAGCVIPAFLPTLTSMTQLTEIAKNIHRIQNKAPHHYGRPGSGNPLHRLVNEAQRRRNRRIVCGKKVVGSPPKGKSCDEYPFATTHEGGHAIPAADRGWAWVPEEDQNSQGGLLRKFYYQNRVLDLDGFWVAV